MDNQKIPTTEVCVLAQGSSIEGNVQVGANLRLEGEIKGDVTCKGRLVMSKSANIVGNITCNEMISEGKIDGNILAHSSITLLESATINGDIQCTQLQIDKGAIFNGKCSMLKKEK